MTQAVGPGSCSVGRPLKQRARKSFAAMGPPVIVFPSKRQPVEPLPRLKIPVLSDVMVLFRTMAPRALASRRHDVVIQRVGARLIDQPGGCGSGVRGAPGEQDAAGQHGQQGDGDKPYLHSFPSFVWAPRMWEHSCGLYAGSVAKTWSSGQ